MLMYNPQNRVKPFEAIKHPFFAEKGIDLDNVKSYYNEFDKKISVIPMGDELIDGDSFIFEK